MGIGGGYGSDCGSITISGGFVWATAVADPKNSEGPEGKRVYANTLTISSPAIDKNVPVTDGIIDGVAASDEAPDTAGIYGIKDVKTDTTGKVCFWLPANETETAFVKLTADD
jgi:hypothetical protein